MTIQLRDGSEVQDRRLDRIEQFDEKSRAHGVMTLAPPDQPRDREWKLYTTLDQGNQGACVGYSWTHELLCWPQRSVGTDGKFATEQVYWPAQRNDPFEGGSYPGATPIMSGTSVLAGVQALVARGAYTGYKWAFTELDLQLGLGHVGPGVLGTVWYDGMYEPDANGFIWPTGTVVGGHAILVRGVNMKKRYYLLHNSWGQGWGNNGTCKVSFEAMAELRAQEGEVCFPVGRTRVVYKAAA